MRMRQTLSWAALMLVSCSSAAIASTQPIAAFDYVSYSGTPDAEHANVPADSYANPVLPGFAPDPSIVRRGDDYYLVTSTFSWFPGLPIYHSRDLVNWTQIGNALDRPSQMDLGNLGVTRALFAPTIQFHDGLFYILNTCVECGDNFILTAKDPAGPWSDPIWLPFGGIDPSLFVDEDGRGWISYNDAPPGPPEYEGHRALWLQEIDMKTLKLMPARTLLRDKGVALGRLDGRYLGDEADDVAETPEADVSGYAIGSAYSALLNQYLSANLGVKMDRPYMISSEAASTNWNYRDVPEGEYWEPHYLNVSAQLTTAMRQNTAMKVWVANGYFDMITPFFDAEITFARYGIPQERVAMTYYQAGHMMYLNEPAIDALAADLRTFYAGKLEDQRPD